MTIELGLRERKKQQTRRRIAEAAMALFAERGFDQVPVAEIARSADVSEATVFNYFANKEDLVYQGMEEFETALIEAIRQRPAGTSVLQAYRDFVLQPRGALLDASPEAIAQVATVARIIAGSPTLQSRERQTFDRYTGVLAQLISTETGAGADDVEPHVVATALMGVNRAMKDLVHRLAQSGHRGAHITAEVFAQGHRALDLLERGLAGYPDTSATA
ncbi:MAG TPA: TetR/AcrR family transcriptional regulator [Pseudonocardiaceae bacterium]